MKRQRAKFPWDLYWEKKTYKLKRCIHLRDVLTHYKALSCHIRLFKCILRQFSTLQNFVFTVFQKVFAKLSVIFWIKIRDFTQKAKSRGGTPLESNGAGKNGTCETDTRGERELTHHVPALLVGKIDQSQVLWRKLLNWKFVATKQN